MELTLKLADFEVTAAVVVSEEVDDLILGIDWLGRHHCRWSFDQNLIEIDGRVVRLINRPRRSQVGRIYAVDNTVISAGQCTGDHGLIVAPPDVGGLGRGTAVSGNRGISRQDPDEVRRASFGRPGDECWREDFVLRQGEFIGEAERVRTVDNGERIAKPPVGADVLSEGVEVWTERPVIE